MENLQKSVMYLHIQYTEMPNRFKKFDTETVLTDDEELWKKNLENASNFTLNFLFGSYKLRTK